ncbi:MAG TPA: MGMT family protein [Clostridia bacterium]|nr:MGMT family protein [Clostridia bacterium]
MKFFDRVYEVVKQIPCGRVASYGTVAAAAGNARMARQVGWALHLNPCPGVIPCHRVVTKDGFVAATFVFGGGSRQRELLENEGVKFDDEGKVKREFFVDYFFL